MTTLVLGSLALHFAIYWPLYAIFFLLGTGYGVYALLYHGQDRNKELEQEREVLELTAEEQLAHTSRYLPGEVPEFIESVDWQMTQFRAHPAGVILRLQLPTSALFTLHSIPIRVSNALVMKAERAPDFMRPLNHWLEVLLEERDIGPGITLFETLLEGTRHGEARLSEVSIAAHTLSLWFRFSRPVTSSEQERFVATAMRTLVDSARHIHALRWEVDPLTLKQRFIDMFLRSSLGRATVLDPLAVELLTCFTLTEQERRPIIACSPTFVIEPVPREALMKSDHPLRIWQALDGATVEQVKGLYPSHMQTEKGAAIATWLVDHTDDVRALIDEGLLRSPELEQVKLSWLATADLEEAREALEEWSTQAEQQVMQQRGFLQMLFQLSGELTEQAWFSEMLETHLLHVRSYNPDLAYSMISVDGISEQGRAAFIRTFYEESLDARNVRIPYLVRKAVFHSRSAEVFDEVFLKNLLADAPLNGALEDAEHGQQFLDVPAPLAVLESFCQKSMRHIELEQLELRRCAHDLFLKALEACDGHATWLEYLDGTAPVILAEPRAHDHAPEHSVSIRSTLHAYVSRALTARVMRQSMLLALITLIRRSHSHRKDYEHARERLLDRFDLAAQQGALTETHGTSEGALSVSPESGQD